MAINMTFHRNWEPSGISRMICAVLTMLSTLFYLAMAGVWLAHLPGSIGLLVNAYKQAASSGYTSDESEPEKKLRRFGYNSFITGSTVRNCEPR
jgi:hypothetical protein